MRQPKVLWGWMCVLNKEQYTKTYTRKNVTIRALVELLDSLISILSLGVLWSHYCLYVLTIQVSPNLKPYIS